MSFPHKILTNFYITQFFFEKKRQRKNQKYLRFCLGFLF